MPVGSFYGALAASASVFLGILTALISNRISQIQSERRRLKQRKSEIETEISNLKDRVENVNQELGRIDEKRKKIAEDEAPENVDLFEEAIENGDFSCPAEFADEHQIYELLAKFLQVNTNELDEGIEIDPHYQEIEDRSTDIRLRLSQSSISDFAADYDFPSFSATGIMDHSDPSKLNPDSRKEAFINSYKEHHDLSELLPLTRKQLSSEFDRRQGPPTFAPELASMNISGPSTAPIYNPPKTIEADRYNELEYQKRGLRADIENKNHQLETVENDMESTTPLELMPVFYTSLLAAIMSILIPIFGFWMKESQTCFICLSWTQRNWSLIIFVIWFIGFTLSFMIIYIEIRYTEQTPSEVVKYSMTNFKHIFHRG